DIGQSSLDPNERSVVVELGHDVACGKSGGARQRLRSGFPILDFSGNHENRIDLDTDRQLIAIAVIDIDAARADFKCALLLALSTFLVISGVDDVKKIQAGPDRRSPKPHDGYQNVNPP